MSNEHSKQEIRDQIRNSLRPLMEEAREKGLWFLTRGFLHGGMWFSPDALDADHDKGHMLWSPENWVLRSPDERTDQLRAAVKKAQAELDGHLAWLKAS